MKRAVVMFQLSFLLIVSLLSQEPDPSKITQMKDQWTGTDEQKIWGLMTIWSEAKFNFPFFDRIPDVDWDFEAREYIPLPGWRSWKWETISLYVSISRRKS